METDSSSNARSVTLSSIGILVGLAFVYYWNIAYPQTDFDFDSKVPPQPITGNHESPAIPVPMVAKKDPLPVRTGFPSRLTIPKIRVDAVIEHVGLTADGAMGTPKKLTNTAWYDESPRPGDLGSSVIDGHFWRKYGNPTAFSRLHELKSGDFVNVSDEHGTSRTFIVRETKTYGEFEVVPEIFASNDGIAHLNLITCKGTWIETKNGYSDRLVVFTDLVN